MDTVTEHNLAEVYQDRYKELFRQGVANSGPLLEQAQRVRRSMIQKYWSNPHTQDLFFRTWQQIQDTLAKVKTKPSLRELLMFGAGDMQDVNGTLVPAFKLPGVLSYSLPRTAVETILSLPFLDELKDEISRVFAESELENSTPFFRTILKNGRSVIYGSNSCRLSSLLGIAHELGHCLVENRVIRSTRKSGIISETIAQVLEEISVIEVLKDLSLPHDHWVQYQRKLDALNFHFLAIEFGELMKEVFPTDKVFKEGSFVFRDSLFLNPGYQIIYASSSNLRLDYLCQSSRVFLDATDWKVLWPWATASIQKKSGGTLHVTSN